MKYWGLLKVDSHGRFERPEVVGIYGDFAEALSAVIGPKLARRVVSHPSRLMTDSSLRRRVFSRLSCRSGMQLVEIDPLHEHCLSNRSNSCAINVERLVEFLHSR